MCTTAVNQHQARHNRSCANISWQVASNQIHRFSDFLNGVCSPQQKLPSVQLCYCLLWMACSFVPSKQQRHDTIPSMWTFSCDWFNLYTVVSNGLAGSQDGNVSLSTTMGWLLQHLSSPDKKSLMTCRLLIQHHHQVKVLTVQHFDLWPNTCKTNDITIYWFPSIIFTTLLLKGSWAAGWSQLTFGRTDC